jgi:AAA ATPase domain
MKIKIRNFGPIRSFDFNTKDDFVLIVGQNNIGKSYAISLVYLILKTLVLSSKLSFGYFDESGFDEFDTIPGAGLKNWFPNFKEKVTGLGEYTNDIDVSNDIAQQFGGMFEAMILPRLRESLYGTYNDLANLQNRLTTDPMEITLETDDSEARLSLHDDKLKVNGIDLHKHKYAVRVVKAIRTVKDSSQKSIIYFPLDSPSQFEKNYSGLLVNLFFRFIQDAARDVLDMHFLPASRSGLYQALSAFG